MNLQPLLCQKALLLTCSISGEAYTRVRSALVRILEADDVVNVNEVTGFASVKAYGGIGFVAAIVEFFAVIVVCKCWRDYV